MQFIFMKTVSDCRFYPILLWRFFSPQPVNPFPNRPWFLSVCRTSLLKTLWEKEKLLVTSNFSFSNSVLYLFGELSATFYLTILTFNDPEKEAFLKHLSSANAFILDNSEDLSFGRVKGLLLQGLIPFTR